MSSAGRCSARKRARCGPPSAPYHSMMSILGHVQPQEGPCYSESFLLSVDGALGNCGNSFGIISLPPRFRGDQRAAAVKASGHQALHLAASSRLEPRTMLALRIGLAEVEHVRKVQIEPHDHRRAAAVVVEHVTSDHDLPSLVHRQGCLANREASALRVEHLDHGTQQGAVKPAFDVAFQDISRLDCDPLAEMLCFNE